MIGFRLCPAGGTFSFMFAVLSVLRHMRDLEHTHFLTFSFTLRVTEEVVRKVGLSTAKTDQKKYILSVKTGLFTDKT